MDVGEVAVLAPRSRGRGWKPVAVAAAAATATAVAGGLITEIGPWYRGLVKPAFQPPDWLFGPAWTLIFTLAATAGVRAWSAPPTAGRGGMVGLFALNGVLNVGWSLLFFRLHRPDWAAVEVVALWLSVGALVVVAGRRDRAAGWLLLPYLAWVTFAAVLNMTLVRLNPPFG